MSEKKIICVGIVVGIITLIIGVTPLFSNSDSEILDNYSNSTNKKENNVSEQIVKNEIIETNNQISNNNYNENNNNTTDMKFITQNDNTTSNNNLNNNLNNDSFNNSLNNDGKEDTNKEINNDIKDNEEETNLNNENSKENDNIVTDNNTSIENEAVVERKKENKKPSLKNVVIIKKEDTKKITLIDKSNGACAQQIEYFYEDSNYKYYFTCKKSQNMYVIVNNKTYGLVYALENKIVTMEELNENGYTFPKESKNLAVR